MSASVAQRPFFHVGGTLGAVAPSYVERVADRLLYDALLAGISCSVFDSRQMGKSSLQLRTRNRLAASGARCATVDLSRLGGTGTRPDEWVASIASEIWRGFAIEGDFFDWWKARASITAIARLDRLLVERVSSVSSRAYIFFDEIDSVFALPFPADDFFSWLRSLCAPDRQARFAIAMFGVVTPSELIRSTATTPFNVGTAIPLGDFTLKEAKPLAAGLRELGVPAEDLLTEVMSWTGGQPFLTQKVCRLVALAGSSAIPASERVSTIVREQIIEDWEQKDEPEHLRSIRNRLLRHADAAPRLLSLYREALSGEAQVTGERDERELLLSGIVVRDREYLRVRNPVYAEVFSRAWADAQLAAVRPWAAAVEAWQESQERDSSRLLRGTALEEAVTWSRYRNLSDLDHRFLRASEEADRATEERAREAERNRARLVQREADLKRQRRRNAALSAALAIAGLLALAAGWQWRQARVNEAHARQHERQAEQVSAFLTELFKLSDPGQSPAQLDALELLERGATRIEALRNEPLTQARVMATIGSIYTQLGRLDEAERFIRGSLSLREKSHAAPIEIADSLHRLGVLLVYRRSNADVPLRRALAIREREYGEWHADVAATVNALAVSKAARNRLDEAEPLFRRALAIRRKTLGADHPDVAQSLHNLSGLAQARGDSATALQLALETLAIRERVLPPTHPDVAGTVEGVGLALFTLRRYGEAERYLQRAVSAYEQSVGPANPRLASTLTTLGDLYSALRRDREAEQAYRRALSIATTSRGPNHPSIASLLQSIATLLIRNGRLSEAAPMLAGALDIRVKDGTDPAAVRSVASAYANVLRQLGRTEEAVSVAAAYYKDK